MQWVVVFDNDNYSCSKSVFPVARHDSDFGPICIILANGW